MLPFERQEEVNSRALRELVLSMRHTDELIRFSEL